MENYITPGVYVNGPVSLPPPEDLAAFAGFTEKAVKNGKAVFGKAVRISSPGEFRDIFGGPPPVSGRLIREAGKFKFISTPGTRFLLYYSVKMFFANGGKRCLVVSAGGYDSTLGVSELKAALQVLGNLPDREATLLAVPDAVLLPEGDYLEIQKEMLGYCADGEDCLAVLDIREGFLPRSDKDKDVIKRFRDGIGADHLSFGAAYYPWLNSTLLSGSDLQPDFIRNLKEWPELTADKALWKAATEAILEEVNCLPASGAIAGMMILTARDRGVWKAPANVSLTQVASLSVSISDMEQEDLNTPADGKAVNAIRNFSGSGILVWGARTLAGNDNEWRYIPVRRGANQLSRFVKQCLSAAVFEPNDQPLWDRLRQQISDYLNGQWRDGALLGSKPEESFFARVGLGSTMTQADIEAGIVRVMVGFAPLRPAEFVILNFEIRLS